MLVCALVAHDQTTNDKALAGVVRGLELHLDGDLRINREVAASLATIRTLERTMQPALA